MEDEAVNGTDNTSLYRAQFPQKNAKHLLVQRTSLVSPVPWSYIKTKTKLISVHKYFSSVLMTKMTCQAKLKITWMQQK